jgi:hypothetical protein
MSHDPTAEGTAPTAGPTAPSTRPQQLKLIIAPVWRQARLFADDRGWPDDLWRYAGDRLHLHGYRLDRWEVWWLDGLWPCRTHRDVQRMNEMMAYARARGADIRRWYT